MKCKEGTSPLTKLRIIHVTGQFLIVIGALVSFSATSAQIPYYVEQEKTFKRLEKILRLELID